MTDPQHKAEAASTINHAAWIGYFLGPVFLLITLLTDPPGGMPQAAWLAVGLTLLMATWWSTEAIPIPATSLLPVILVPALGLGTVKEATAPFADPVIFLFLGGFVIGLAMQRWNLHKRIALMTLLAVGPKPTHQIGGFMLATGFISMWVSNTATSIMMLPIGLSIISMIQSDNKVETERYATALLLAIAYAASLGGIATLIGTPPNALLAGYLNNTHGIELGFGKWMLVGLPITISMMVFTWWWLTRKGFSAELSGQGTSYLREELEKLGPLSRGEKTVAIVFLLAAAAWIFQPLLSKMIPWVNDTVIAITAAVALFLIPVDRKTRTFAMSWDYAQGIPWGVLLLFGGGLSMAGIVKSSGLAVWIAESLGAFGILPILLIICIVVTVIIFLTEVTSNTATAAAFLPLLGALAVSQDVSPLLFTVPAALAASCAFMMPVATPPNAIVFGTGHMKISSMIKAGFALNLAGIVVITLVAYGLVSVVWTTVG